MPQKKKRHSQKRRILLAAVIIIIAAFGGYYALSLQNNTGPSPLQKFKSESWMQLVPSDADRFRFLNITKLSKYEGLITNTVVVYTPDLDSNITIPDLSYGLDIEIFGQFVNILGVNRTTANRVNVELSDRGLQHVVYGNASIYEIRTPLASQGNTGWISVFKDIIIYVEGNQTALRAIQSVMDAQTNGLFSSNSSKIGFVLTYGDKSYLAFSFLKFVDNELKIKWSMTSIFGSAQMTKREAFFFATEQDSSDNYQQVIDNFLVSADRTYRSNQLLFGDYSIASTELRSKIMGM